MSKGILANEQRRTKQFYKKAGSYTKPLGRVKLNKGFSFWFQIITYPILAILIIIVLVNAL